MQVLTLELEDDYALIGIHSTEEDYRLAYLLNKHLHMELSRFTDALDFENSAAQFPLFEYKDKKNLLNYYLINNTHLRFEDQENSETLFEGNYTMSYLVPEKKNVDYFLKIEGCQNSSFEEKIAGTLKDIDQVITAYPIDPESLKSKNNLIF